MLTKMKLISFSVLEASKVGMQNICNLYVTKKSPPETIKLTKQTTKKKKKTKENKIKIQTQAKNNQTHT